MEKIHIKEAEQWGWWELASKTMAPEPSAVFACSGEECDQSIVAKDAMHEGWVRLGYVGAEEPEKEPATIDDSKFYCPACQLKLGIDIEEGYAERPAPPNDRSGRSGRNGGRRNQSRRSGNNRGGSGNKRNGARPNRGGNGKKPSGETEKQNAEGVPGEEGNAKQGGRSGNSKNGGRRGGGSRNRNRRSRSGSPKGADGGSKGQEGSNKPAGPGAAGPGGESSS